MGDCIHNLRCALDHIAYALVLANNGEPTIRTMFPIYDLPHVYSEQVKTRLAGVAEKPAAFINSVQPYHRGHLHPNHTGTMPWVLDKLENIDKHRRLALLGVIGVVRKYTFIDDRGKPRARRNRNDHLAGMVSISVAHFEHRTLFGAAVALVIHAGGGNIGVTEHLLHFRQIRAVL